MDNLIQGALSNIQKTASNLFHPIQQEAQALPSQIQSGFNNVQHFAQPAINNVGSFIGQQSAFNNPLPQLPQFKMQLPNLNQVAQKIAPNSAVSAFTSGQSQNILPNLENTNKQANQQNLGITAQGVQNIANTPNQTIPQKLNQLTSSSHMTPQNVSNVLMGMTGAPDSKFSQEQINMVKSGFNSDVRDLVGQFTTQVSKNPNKNLGQLGDYVQSLAQTVFGDKATGMTNKQLANAFDTIQEQAFNSKLKPTMNIGLGTKDVPHSPEIAGTPPVANAGLTPQIPPELTGLAQEARKYKTLGEFQQAWNDVNLGKGDPALKEAMGNVLSYKQNGGKNIHLADFYKQANVGQAGLYDTGKLYHGTNNPDAILKNGFSISGKAQEGSSFLGDNFVNGVHLSTSKAPYAEGGQLADVSKVLDVQHSAKNVLQTDLKGIGKLYEKYGINELAPNHATELTNALKKDGYDGLAYNGEVVVFDPKNVRVAQPTIGGVADIPLSKLQIVESGPRGAAGKSFTKGPIEAVLNPDTGKYEIQDGATRYEEALKRGDTTIPTKIIQATPERDSATGEITGWNPTQPTIADTTPQGMVKLKLKPTTPVEQAVDAQLKPKTPLVTPKEPLPWETASKEAGIPSGLERQETIGPKGEIVPQQTSELSQKLPSGVTVPPTPEENATPIKTAATNAISELTGVRQNINETGTNVAQIVDRGVKGPQETRLFRDTIEHPENLTENLKNVSNPGKFENAVGQFRKFTDFVHQQYTNTGDKIGFVENFYSHIIDLSDPLTKERYDNFVSQASNTRGWFTKERIFKNIDQLEAAGFKLKHGTVPEDIMQYTNSTARTAGANAFIKEIQKTHPNEIAILKDSGAVPTDANGQAFVQLNHPGLQGTFVSPELYSHVKNALGRSDIADNNFVQAFDKVNTGVKTVQLGLGGFHAFKTTARELVNNPTIIPRAVLNAFSKDARLAFRQEAVEDGTIAYGSKMNVTFGKSGDVMLPDANVVEKLNSKNPLNKANEGLFGGLIDTYKIDLVRQAKNQFGDLTNPKQLIEARKYGAQINNLMGGLNLAVIGRNKTVQQLLRATFLAPDFNEGKIRQIATSANLTDWSPAAIFARKNLVGEAVVLGTLAELGRRLTTGKFDTNFNQFVQNAIIDPNIPLPSQFDSSTGKKQTAGLPGSDISDIARAVKDPNQFIQARGSAGLALASKVITNKDYYGNPIVPPNGNVVSGALKVAQSQLPIPAVQALKVAQKQETPGTAILNTIGFRVHNDPNDPKNKAINDFFAGRDAAAKSLNENDQKIFLGQIHPTAKDAQGNPIVDKNPISSAAKYETLLAHPNVLAAEVKFQQSQPNHDPFWDWTPQQRQAYMQAQVISKNDPGGDKATVNALYSAIPQALFDKRTLFFNSLVASGQMKAQQPGQYSVATPTAISNFWNQYFQYPQGSAQRKQMIQSPQGQQAMALSQEKTNLTNQQRLDMGLPLLAASSGGGYGFGGVKGLHPPLRPRAPRTTIMRRKKITIGKSKRVKLQKLTSISLGSAKPAKATKTPSGVRLAVKSPAKFKVKA